MSLTIDSPTSTSPVHNDKIAPGILFFSKTDVIIFVVATEVREVVGAPFQITALPHTYCLYFNKTYVEENLHAFQKFTMDMALFQP